jgi:glutamyl-tRNA reductase
MHKKSAAYKQLGNSSDSELDFPFGKDKKFKVLLLGSGMMTATLIEYLTKFGDTHITVASNVLKEAQILGEKYGSSVLAVFLDIKNI